MVSPISNVTQTQPVAQTTSTSKSAQSKPQAVTNTTSTDSVHLSQAAQAMVTAMKEATETPFQTAQEASRGDLQAVRLLAREKAEG